MDFLQLAHKVDLGMQSAGGIDDEDIEAARRRLFAGIVGHAGRVAALLILDDFTTQPLAPNCQLLDRRRTKRIAGGHHDLLLLILAPLHELGDGRGLARTVHARNHHHGRTARHKMNSFARSAEERLQLIHDEGLHVAADFFVLKSLPNIRDDLLGGHGSYIS